jgi:hypothetical protein
MPGVFLDRHGDNCRIDRIARVGPPRRLLIGAFFRTRCSDLSAAAVRLGRRAQAGAAAGMADSYS